MGSVHAVNYLDENMALSPICADMILTQMQQGKFGTNEEAIQNPDIENENPFGQGLLSKSENVIDQK